MSYIVQGEGTVQMELVPARGIGCTYQAPFAAPIEKSYNHVSYLRSAQLATSSVWPRRIQGASGLYSSRRKATSNSALELTYRHPAQGV